MSAPSEVGEKKQEIKKPPSSGKARLKSVVKPSSATNPSHVYASGSSGQPQMAARVKVQVDAAKSVEHASKDIEFPKIDKTDIIVVDSATTLLSLLDNFINLTIDPPSLYFDLEGVRLGRHGSISIISLYIAPIKKIYLIDIHRLGKTAFSTTNPCGITLKSILENLQLSPKSSSTFATIPMPYLAISRFLLMVSKTSNLWNSQPGMAQSISSPG
jgi:hypothetical protein